MSLNTDILSYILYIVLGCIGSFCLYFVKRKEAKEGSKQSLFSKPYIIWWVLWTIIATFRYVAKGYGGSDAIDYIGCFYNNYDKSVYICTHYDALFRWFSQFIGFFAHHHYFYFFIIYGIFTAVYIWLFNELTPQKTNFSPYILIIFVFLRGFTTIRTNLAVALLLIGVILYKKDYKKLSLFFMLSTFFIQKASLLYTLLFFFLEFTKIKKIDIKQCVFMFFGSFLIGKLAQYVLTLDILKGVLNGAYASYAERSLNTSFFDNFWKICFGQMLLLFFLIIFNKWIKKDINSSNNERKENLNFIYKVCLFDFATIPITYILSIWRGYEYLYVIRLIMWGEIIYLIQSSARKLTFEKLKEFINNTKQKKLKQYLNKINDKILKTFVKCFNSKIVNIACIVIIICWFVFRLSSVAKSSSLVPYFFEPFMWIK